MSRIVRPTAFGSPEVLAVDEVPTPRAGTDGVVVEVRAAGVNPVDWKPYSGSFHAVDNTHSDEVIVYPVTAASADHVGAPASSIVPEPAGLGWAQAGGLMLAGTTAAHAPHAAGVGAGTRCWSTAGPAGWG